MEVLTARATCSWPASVLGAFFPIEERAGGAVESVAGASVAGTIGPATAGHPRTSRDHIVWRKSWAAPRSYQVLCCHSSSRGAG